MTFDELTAALPNGLHDAHLNAVTIDFARGEARVDLAIWLGDEHELETYRQAQITLLGLCFWISEPPDPRYPFAEPTALKIDAGPLTDKIPEKQPVLPPVPNDKFANWIFVSAWNAFIFFAAGEASLAWIGEAWIGSPRRTTAGKS